MSSYLLKISLRGTPNLVWRRFVVPSFTNLGRLHEIVQTVMGWQRKHDHIFTLRKKNYVPGQNGDPDEYPEDLFSLDDIAFQCRSSLRYIYDPQGDRWIHEINVESVRYVNSDWPYPVYCLEGVRACPPESCGGIVGFAHLLKVLGNSEDPEYGNCVKQFKDYNPDRFDLNKVNKAFKVHAPTERRREIDSRFEAKPETDESESRSNENNPLYRLGRTLKKRAAS